MYQRVVSFTDLSVPFGATAVIFTDKNIDKLIGGSWNGTYAYADRSDVVNGFLVKRTNGEIAIMNRFTNGTYSFSGLAILKYTKITDNDSTIVSSTTFISKPVLASGSSAKDVTVSALNVMEAPASSVKLAN